MKNLLILLSAGIADMLKIKRIYAYDEPEDIEKEQEKEQENKRQDWIEIFSQDGFERGGIENFLQNGFDSPFPTKEFQEEEILKEMGESLQKYFNNFRIFVNVVPREIRLELNDRSLRTIMKDELEYQAECHQDQPQNDIEDEYEY